MNRNPVSCLLISSALMLPLAAPMAAAQNEVSVPALAPDAAPETVDAMGIEVVDHMAEPVEILARDYQTTLQSLHDGVRTVDLNWRQAEQVLRFDLTSTDKVEALSLSLSMSSHEDDAPDAPLTLQFNSGIKHEVATDGVTTITLDPKRARARGNELRIGFPSGCEAGHAQTTHPRSGGFTLDLSASDLAITARSDGNGLSMRDLEARLSGATFTPDTVGLIANGPMATRYQGLAAQGLALRMMEIPDFRTEDVDTDFDLVMATRLELAAKDDVSLLTTDADVMTGTGPALILSKEHPTRLYITGDTADDVLRAVSAFATSFLPRTTNAKVSPADILVQSPLDFDRRRLDGSIRLSALSVETGTVRQYEFDVADPEALSGDLVLHLKRDSRTSAGAKLNATLNGADLGLARLDGRRKTASYPIRPGLLVGSDNRLVLTTEDASDTPHCAASDPFIAIGSQSTLHLSTDTPSAPTDLSRLAADGSVFGAQNGADTVFVLPKQPADYEAALKVVAQLAKVNGRGWTSAMFSRGGTDDPNRHHLVIEPYHELDLAYKGAAPRTMKAAWRGEQVEGRNRVAAYARLNDIPAPAVGRIGPGGTAAIFPLDETRLVGLITNTPEQTFAAAIAPLTGPLNWNGLAGGVARWSENAVVSTQTALSLPDAVPDPLTISDADIVGADQGFVFSMPAIDLPNVELSNAGDWIHRRWREISQARTPETPLPTPTPTPSETSPDGSAPSARPPQSSTASPEPSAGLNTLKARMDSGFLSRLDLWKTGSALQEPDKGLHPAALAVLLLLLGGLTRLMLQRAASRNLQTD